jgi:hypothetical protein
VEVFVRKALLFLFVMTVGGSAFAGEMEKLDFLKGEWKGEAWSQIGRGERTYVSHSETVVPKAGGKALLVEGLGRQKEKDGSIGAVVHETVGLIAWDETRKEYRFVAHVADKPSVDTVLEVTGPNEARWGFAVPTGRVRFTITLTEKGEWHEVGEFTPDDGGKWFKFFEMTLQKVK